MGRRKAKRQAPGITTGVEECLNEAERTELVHGGQRPVGGMENRRSKVLPQIGHSTNSFGKDGECKRSMSGIGDGESASRNSRRAARNRRWEEPKKPK